MITSSIVIVSQNNSSVKATGGQTQQGEQGIAFGLDLNYMWGNTVNISNAVHKAYHGQELRKGRLFGSNGTEVYARGIIYKEMKYKLNLDGVQNITLGPINNMAYYGRNYTSNLNVTNFNFHINTPEYTLTNLPRDVPKNETYATPSAVGDYGSSNNLNYNFTGTNVYIDIQNNFWPFAGTVTKHNYFVSCQPLGECDRVLGTVVYVNVTSRMPTNQCGKIILINETNNCTDKLNNATNPNAIVLIHASNGYTSQVPSLTTTLSTSYGSIRPWKYTMSRRSSIWVNS